MKAEINFLNAVLPSPGYMAQAGPVRQLMKLNRKAFVIRRNSRSDCIGKTWSLGPDSKYRHPHGQ